MSRRLIDLTQPLGRHTQVQDIFPPVQILRYLRHSDVPEGAHSINVELLAFANHVATHVDALAHFDPSPDAPKIDEMALELFCGTAVCVDVREYPPGHAVTAREIERAVKRDGLTLRSGDILLLCTDHYNRTKGTPEFFTGYSGLDAKAVHWMADQGVKIFGVEPLSPDLVFKARCWTTIEDAGIRLPANMPVHDACRDRGLPHYEGLANLCEVVGRRFEFYGFPLRLELAAGSPVRAVASLAIEDRE